MRCEICFKENGREKRLRTDDNRLVCSSCYICFSTLRDEYKKNDSKHRYNSPFSAVPPIGVLKKAKIALNISGSYQPFADVLADHYGTVPPRYLVKPEEVSEKAIACYSHPNNEVYSKTKEMTLNTALHEFYHSLQFFHIVPRNEYSEKDTRNFAAACEEILLGG